MDNISESVTNHFKFKLRSEICLVSETRFTAGKVTGTHFTGHIATGRVLTA